MDTIEIIDYAVMKTIAKGGAFAESANIKSRFKNYYYCGDSTGFTRDGNAREYISSLGVNDIKKELLKNIVKCRACASYNQYGASLLSVKKSYGDELTYDELEFLIYQDIERYPLDTIEYIFEKYPIYLSMIIDSFVTKRYFSQGYSISKLEDKRIISPYYENLLDKIDNYYIGDLENSNTRGFKY